MATKKKVYLPSGWFTDEQAYTRDRILATLKETGVKVFSPQHDGVQLDKSSPKGVFENNIKEIDSSDVVVVNTEGKDPGTLWEAGYAYAKGKIVVYVWIRPEGKFNLMLSESGNATYTTLPSLYQGMMELVSKGSITSRPYGGEIE